MIYHSIKLNSIIFPLHVLNYFTVLSVSSVDKQCIEELSENKRKTLVRIDNTVDNIDKNFNYQWINQLRI